MQHTAKQLAKIVVERLEKIYGRQMGHLNLSTMDQLIATILSQRTNYADEKAAYDRLKTEFDGWEGVAAAPVEKVVEAIRTSRFPEVKAPQIQEVIRRIIADRGEANLDFLCNLPLVSARQYLQSLPGVGNKTSTFVLLFVCKQAVLPVDTHVHRVSTRTGILPANTTADQAHFALLKHLPNRPEELINFHKLLFKHGQRICTYRDPQCELCVLKDICRFYQKIHADAPPTLFG